MTRVRIRLASGVLIAFAVFINLELANAGRCETVFRSTAVESRGEISDRALDGFLRTAFDVSRPSDLRQLIVRELGNSDFRIALDRWLEREFVRESRQIRSSGFKGVSEVIVGAGVHSFTLLASQSREKVGKTLVVERGSVGSTFHGKRFQMNSDQAGDLNRIPGAIFQMSDITSISRAPDAEDFGFLLRLNYRALGIRVLLGHEYVGASLAPRPRRAPLVNVQLTELASGNRVSLKAERLGLATGMDVRSLKHFEKVSQAVEKALASSEVGSLPEATRGLTTGPAFLRLANRTLTGENSYAFTGLRVGVLGSKHEALTVAEAVLQLIRAKKMPKNAKISLFGLKSTDAKEFRDEVTPKSGSEQFKEMIRSRYLAQGIPEALDSGTIFGVPGHATTIQLRSSGVEVKTDLGRTLDFDLLIVATGYDRSAGAWATTRLSLVSDPSVEAVEIKAPGFKDPVGFGLVSRRNSRGTLLIYGFGVNAALPISAERLQGPIANADSLFVTLPATEKLGSLLESH